MTLESADTPLYMYELAMIYGERGNLEEALRWLQEARQVAVTYSREDVIEIIDQDLRKLQ